MLFGITAEGLEGARLTRPRNGAPPGVRFEQIATAPRTCSKIRKSLTWTMPKSRFAKNQARVAKRSEMA